MIKLVKFIPHHFHQIDEQEETKEVSQLFTLANLLELQRSKHSYTLLDGNRVLMCTGIVKYYEDRGEVWAIMGRNLRKEMFSIHKMAKRFLEMAPFKRLEATVSYTFEPGHRWVKMLGFTKEAELMKHYLPDGRDASLYSLVR